MDFSRLFFLLEEEAMLLLGYLAVCRCYIFLHLFRFILELKTPQELAAFTFAVISHRRFEVTTNK